MPLREGDEGARAVIHGGVMNVAAENGLVRLSTHVLFVDYGHEIEVQHTVRGRTHRVDRGTYEALLGFRGFRPRGEQHTRWLEAGVLVPPFRDRPEDHGGLRPGTEAQLGQDYQDWYWQREVEAEREYRWLGHGLVKMPSDIFFYQELLAQHRLDGVLEIGYGDGGGLWFFATVLAILGGGLVVGVDQERAERLPPFERLAGVRVALVHGDAHDGAVVDTVQALRPDGFGLVVVDADPRPEGKVALLDRWSVAVAPRGYLVVEDVTAPECRDASGEVEAGLDTFLLENPGFGVALESVRFPLLKGRGAVFQRLEYSGP